MALNQPETVWKRLGVLPAPVHASTPRVGGNFPTEWHDMLDDLFGLWEGKLARNRMRKRYYNGKNVLKDFGIAIPPQLLHVETVVGWPQKAVDTMAVRSRFDGFSATDPDVQAVLDRLVEWSRLRVKYRQSVQSALIYSCAFATVAVDGGAPRSDMHSAARAAARWDYATGRIAYGMTIETFNDGETSRVNLYTDDALVRLWDTGAGYWDWSAEYYSMGRPAMEALVYRPTEDRPFGPSRLTRAVMSLTDSAVREALRTEISAEFFTSPQKYLLGVDSDAFASRTKWEAYIGNILAVSRDANGDLPQFGQLSQGSMQPHTEYMRSLAARFSGETNVPISQLGVIHDNPASAEAIYAASEPLVIETEDFNDGARETLRSIALMAMSAAADVPIAELPAEATEFTAVFRNPAMPSVVSQTDAMVKIASVVPGFAGTEVFFEQVGFPEDMRARVASELRRQQAVDAIAALDAAAV